MSTFRSSRIPSPAIITKLAINLFNMWITGQPCAILTMLVAGRMWPFLPQELAEHLPSPYVLAGPTLTPVVDVIRIDYDIRPQHELRPYLPTHTGYGHHGSSGKGKHRSHSRRQNRSVRSSVLVGFLDPQPHRRRSRGF